MQQEQLLLIVQKLVAFWQEPDMNDLSMFSTCQQLANLVIDAVSRPTAKAIQRRPAVHTATIAATLGQLVERDPAARVLVKSLLGNGYATSKPISSSLPPISIQGNNNQISIGHFRGTLKQIMNPPVTAHDGAVSENKLPDRDLLIQLRRFFETRFSEDELRTVCFDLGIDYDNLPSVGKAGKARELVAYYERYGRISELITVARRLRPDVSWDDDADQHMPS